MPIDTRHTEYDAAVEWWTRCRDCAGGSDAVKGKTTKYLPCPSGMSRFGDYVPYVGRAMFYNATNRTIAGLAGMVFQKSPIVTVPARVRPFLADVTLADQSIDLVALEVTREVLTVGRFGVWVDWASDGERPFMAGYVAESIIHWRSTRRDGNALLERVVLRETVEEPDADDASTVTRATQYRELVLSPDGVYRQRLHVRLPAAHLRDPSKVVFVASDWVIPTRRGTPLPFIPFVIFGASALGPHVSRPPLTDLADVNLSHYRSSADREHALYWVSTPTPWVAGSKGTDPLKIGSSVAWDLELTGRAGMLEHSGQGIGALKDAMEEKAAMMSSLGARLLEDQPRAAETATAVGMRHSGEHATLKTLAQTTEQGLTLALQWVCWWLSIEAQPADTGASIELNKDFFAMKLNADELRSLVLAWQADGLSFETLHFNLSRGGLTRPGVSADDEKRAIERSGEMRPIPPMEDAE